MADTLVYVYAVGDAALDGASRASLGIGGVAPVRRVVAERLAAVVSSVDAVRFSEEALRRSLEDLQWLEVTAAAHHAVVDAVAPGRTLSPRSGWPPSTSTTTTSAGSCTSGRRRSPRAPGPGPGCVEWGVKAFADAGAGDRAEPASTRNRPGASYLHAPARPSATGRPPSRGGAGRRRGRAPDDR